MGINLCLKLLQLIFNKTYPNFLLYFFTKFLFLSKKLYLLLPPKPEIIVSKLSNLKY